MKLLDGIVYKLASGCGKGTNTKGELLALWCLLLYAIENNLLFLQIASDSKVIINWLEKRYRL